MRELLLEVVVLLNSVVVVLGLVVKDWIDRRRARKVSRKVDAVAEEVKVVGAEVRNGSGHWSAPSSNGSAK